MRPKMRTVLLYTSAIDSNDSAKTGAYGCNPGSNNVVWWIRDRGEDFRLFLANRVDEIQSFTKPSP